jgi:hypothetical protein
MKYASPWTAVCSALLCLTSPSLAVAVPLSSNRNIDIAVSNDAGALYGSGPSDTYYINAPGGGLNQLHITTDSSAAGVSGQVTTQTISTSSTSGTFWVSTTGGRGYNDDIILLFSVEGAIPDDFSLNIKSSGYQWTPSTAGVVNPVYKDGAVDETFTRADFLYGPQTAKPGPGNGWILPFYSGQNINDPSTAQYLMFVDLDVGNDTSRSSIDSGDAKVEFDISGLYDTTASFNAYAWALSANVANDSINWTNNLSTDPAAPGQSGYSITTTAAPVPEPVPALLLPVALSTIVLVRRRGRAGSRARFCTHGRNLIGAATR